jgi:hypothetical protein
LSVTKISPRSSVATSFVQGRDLVLGWLRNEVAPFTGVGGVADVDHAQTRRKPGDIEHAVAIHDFAQLVRPKANGIAVVVPPVIENDVSF